MAKYSVYVEISTIANKKLVAIAKQPRTLRLQLHRLVVGWFLLVGKVIFGQNYCFTKGFKGIAVQLILSISVGNPL